MPISVTRWEDAAHDPLDMPCREALTQYVEANQVVVPGVTIYGPQDDIPEGQYECRRTWTTVGLAQNWIDNIDSISVPLGFTAISKYVIE
jgi:hypothetical protein